MAPLERHEEVSVKTRTEQRPAGKIVMFAKSGLLLVLIFACLFNPVIIHQSENTFSIHVVVSIEYI